MRAARWAAAEEPSRVYREPPLAADTHTGTSTRAPGGTVRSEGSCACPLGWVAVRWVSTAAQQQLVLRRRVHHRKGAESAESPADWRLPIAGLEKPDSSLPMEPMPPPSAPPPRPAASSSPNPALATPSASPLVRTSSSASLQRAQARRERVAASCPGSSARSRRAGGAARAESASPAATVATPDAWREAPAVQLFGEVCALSLPDSPLVSVWSRSDESVASQQQQQQQPQQQPPQQQQVQQQQQQVQLVEQESRRRATAAEQEREREQSWLAATEERLYAREEAVGAKLAACDDQWARLQRRQEEVAQAESRVAQREAAVQTVRACASLDCAPRFTARLERACAAQCHALSVSTVGTSLTHQPSTQCNATQRRARRCYNSSVR